MSSRVENALKEYKQKYLGKIGGFELSYRDMLDLMKGGAFKIAANSFDVGFVVGVRYAKKMQKALK